MIKVFFLLYKKRCFRWQK